MKGNTEPRFGISQMRLATGHGCGLIASPHQLMSFSDLEISESIQCPCCGQRFELIVDTSIPAQQFTTDCEVCCRPFVVTAECEPGEILSLDVRAD